MHGACQLKMFFLCGGNPSNIKKMQLRGFAVFVDRKCMRFLLREKLAHGPCGEESARGRKNLRARFLDKTQCGEWGPPKSFVFSCQMQVCRMFCWGAVATVIFYEAKAAEYKHSQQTTLALFTKDQWINPDPHDLPATSSSGLWLQSGLRSGPYRDCRGGEGGSLGRITGNSQSGWLWGSGLFAAGTFPWLCPLSCFGYSRSRLRRLQL